MKELNTDEIGGMIIGFSLGVILGIVGIIVL